MHRHLGRLAGLVALSLGGGACVLDRGIEGSGRAATEDRDVGAFDAVRVTDALTASILLAPDQPQRVQVSGDDNLVALVGTRVVGTQLVIDEPTGTSFSKSLPLVVTVSAPALHSLTADDAATADAQVTATAELAVTVNHAAHATVSGAAPALHAQLDDASDLEAQALTATAVTITAATASSAHVCATGSLDATLSVASQVGYRCDPVTVTSHVDGTSTLTKESR